MTRRQNQNSDATCQMNTTVLLGSEQLDQITDADVAQSTARFLPPYPLIPEEFKNGNTRWNHLFSAWFFGHLKTLRVTPKVGIDSQKALRCIQAHMRSNDSKYEHKKAGVAYMMFMLFDDVEWS